MFSYDLFYLLKYITFKHGNTLFFFLCFSLNTPPGTKVKLSGAVDVKNGFLLLNDSNTTVLGGEVEHLIEKWELQRVSVDYEERFELLEYYTFLL